MSNTIQYILSVTDKMSGAFKKAGYLGGNTYDKLQAKQEKLNNSARGLTSTLATLTAGFGVFQIGKAMVTLASDAEETSSKFGVVFSNISHGAEKSAKDLQQNYGLSGLASKKLLSDTGDLLTGFQFSQEMALDLSTKVQKLGVDLASFTNYSGGAEGASKALTKMLLGEREMVKELGIAILEEDVKAKVVAMDAAGKLIGMSERQKKAYASLELAMEQSKNAIGDYARTSDSYANRSRAFMMKLQDLGASVGSKILPSLTRVLGKLIQLVEWADKNTDAIYTWGKRILWIVGVWKTVSISISVASMVSAWYALTVRQANASLYVMNRRLFGVSAASGVYSGMMGVATLATKMFTLSIKTLGKAMFSIPVIGWILAGIAALAAAVEWLWNSSEKFRGFMYGIWEVIKAFFDYNNKALAFLRDNVIKPIWDMLMTFFDYLGQAFSWLYEKIFKPIFEFTAKVTATIINAIKHSWNWLKTNIIDPAWQVLGKFGDFLENIWNGIKDNISKAFEPIIFLWNKLFKDNKIIIDVKEKFSAGYQKGVEDFRADKESKKTEGEPDFLEKLKTGGFSGSGGLPIGGAPGSVSDANTGIIDGGSKPTNITINVSKLIESFVLNSQNLTEGVTEIQDKVEEALLRVLNSANVYG